MQGKRSPKRKATSAFVLSLLVAAAAGAATSITGLGLLPGGTYSDASGVSADGSVVVGIGDTTDGHEQAFRWTSAGGMEGLGYLPGGGWDYSYAGGVSADGSTIVGSSSSADGYQAFRWSGGSMTGLGFLTQGDSSSYAAAASADGSVIVGQSGDQAFRWTAGGGMVGLGDLPGGDEFSTAAGVSADGSVVVGLGHSGLGSQEAYRWTDGGGMVGLGNLEGLPLNSEALGVSADGQVVVGQSMSPSGREAFRWTSGGGMVGLGDLSGGGFESYALASSADGSFIVGYCSPGPDQYDVRAFIWDPANGMRLLSDVLAAGGADLTGWTLISADGISPDGRYVVGGGSLDGVGQGFLADLLGGPSVPEPGALALLSLGGCLSLLGRRRRNPRCPA